MRRWLRTRGKLEGTMVRFHSHRIRKIACRMSTIRVCLFASLSDGSVFMCCKFGKVTSDISFTFGGTNLFITTDSTL